MTLKCEEPQVMTKRQAKQLGLVRYYLGTPCPRGHVAERYTSTAKCVVCAKLDQEKQRETGKRSTYNKTYYEANKEYRYEVMKRAREQKPVQYLLYTAKCRARVNGWDFNVSPEDVEVPEFCPVLGIKLGPFFAPMSQRMNTARDDAPSLDRIDSTKGYVKGNVRIISLRANRLKNNATPEEIVALYRDAIATGMLKENLS